MGVAGVYFKLNLIKVDLNFNFFVLTTIPTDEVDKQMCSIVYKNAFCYKYSLVKFGCSPS